MASIPPTPRVAYSPAEFAKLFGKSQTWGYRQIYAGKVNAITEHGRILIPAKEVERILESAGIYNGQEKPPAVQARVKKMTPQQTSIWQRFLEMRKQEGGFSKAASSRQPQSAGKRHGGAVRSRLAKAWKRQ